MDNRPIGIFDSGVGGLTVVKQVVKALPDEEIIYFGDTARVPYGSKSKETVTRFSIQIIRFLLSKNVKSIIIACNTVSSNCFDELRKIFDVPIIEVVTPGVETCLKTTKNNIVGIIGTEATIRSGAYEKKLKAADSSVKVYSKACPLFVPIAEEGWADNQVAYLTAETYLKELAEKGVDSIILGCTHYPLLKKCIGTVMGDSVTIVDPAYAAARKMKEFLQMNDMLNEGRKHRLTFFVSDDTSKFDLISSKVLKEKHTAVKTDIEKF